MSALGKVAFSFVVDADPRFAYQGWHLARSILEHTDAKPSDINVHLTPEVDARVREVFVRAGFRTHALARFGDGRFCNKISQWTALDDLDADHFVFLDTDVILLSDCCEQLPRHTVCAKVVDLSNPSTDVLDEIMTLAGSSFEPKLCIVDAGDEKTYTGNCNGGMYSVPRLHAATLFSAWKRWAAWLLENSDPLEKANKANHLDQVSFFLAINETGLPFAFASSNVNYFVHFPGEHKYLDPSRSISVLHYHNESLNVVGLLEPKGAVTPLELAAVATANAQMSSSFLNDVFWEFRYTHFAERGSGVGSRGDNAEYKRQLLKAHGAERADSVLDVGCGDLEVVSTLSLKTYVGVDQSRAALEIAGRARPDWTFLPAPAREAPVSELVICFEVLIHQETLEAYRALVEYLAEKSGGVLIVSGYEQPTHAIDSNPMLFFHEPLSRTLAATGKFQSVRVIGSHTDVTVFCCEVVADLGV